MAKSIIHPSNHLSLALAHIMKAAETPRKLMFFLTQLIYHIHELRCPTGDIEEEEQGLITRDNDHLYSALLMLQSVVFPWCVTGGDVPTPEMIEGMDDMLNHFGLEGWQDMANSFTVAMSRDFAQGPSSLKSYMETLQIHTAFCACVNELRQHEEEKARSRKAA